MGPLVSEGQWRKVRAAPGGAGSQGRLRCLPRLLLPSHGPLGQRTSVACLGGARAAGSLVQRILQLSVELDLV